MKIFIDKATKEYPFEDLRNENVEEILFENQEGWVLIFDKLVLDYVMEYCQSTGRGEISGTCVKTIDSGRISMHFTSDGKKNKELIDSYTSISPQFDRPHITYRKIIHK